MTDYKLVPVAWIIRHPRFCGKFTDDKEIAEHWENKEQGCTAPLFLRSQPAPEVTALVEALKEGLRAIGDHHAPDDCYATGPMTGDPFRDFVQCPACSFIAMCDTALAAYRKGGEV